MIYVHILLISIFIIFLCPPCTSSSCSSPRSFSLSPFFPSLYRSYYPSVPPSLLSLFIEQVHRLADHSDTFPLLKDGKRRTFWYNKKDRPRTIVDIIILILYDHLHRDPKYSSIVGMEYWIQRVPVGDSVPISFHVDKDESVASNEQYLFHPLWSSVMYLTSFGGGTLITNQYSPLGSGYHPVVPEEGLWSFLIKNKFILFNGTLLHGVVESLQYDEKITEREEEKK